VSQNLELIAMLTGSGVGGVAVAKAFDWLTERSSNKKLAKKTEAEAGKFDADAVQAITNAAVTLVGPLQGEITKLTLRVDALETENHTTKTLLETAIEHIRALRMWISTHLPDLSPPHPPSVLGIDIERR
jgi:hypothetical protein